MSRWTPEARAKQKAIIRQWKPWEKSTGAKTPEGKAKVARNAYKGGVRQAMADIRAILREQEGELERIRELWL